MYDPHNPKPIEAIAAIALRDPEVAKKFASYDDAVFECSCLKDGIAEMAASYRKLGVMPSKLAMKTALRSDGATPMRIAAIQSVYNKLEQLNTQKLAEALPTYYEVLEKDSERVGYAKRELTALNGLKSPPVDPFAEARTLPFDRFPKRIQIIASYLARSTGEQITIKHVIATLAIIGAAIGKRAEIKNRGNEYYLNLAVAILMPTGGNKGGLHNVIRKLTADALDVSTPTASTLEAFLDRYCTVVPPNKTRTKEETRTLIRQQWQADQCDYGGSMLLVDELRAFLLTMLPKEQATRNAQVLCRLLDRDSIDMATATGGIRVLGDTCFSALGFSQTDAWNDEVRTAAFQTGGLAGRIIPVNEKRFNFAPIEPLNVSEIEAVRALTNLVGALRGDFTSSQKIQVAFSGDSLSEHKAWFAETPQAQSIIETEPDTFASLESKMLMQSAKVAGILALADADGDHPYEVDATPYLKMGYFLVGFSHLGNLGHLCETTEQSKMYQKILGILRRKGAATKRDIARFANLKTYEVEGYIKVLIESGDMRLAPGQRKGIVKYMAI